MPKTDLFDPQKNSVLPLFCWFSMAGVRELDVLAQAVLWCIFALFIDSIPYCNIQGRKIKFNFHDFL